MMDAKWILILIREFIMTAIEEIPRLIAARFSNAVGLPLDPE